LKTRKPITTKFLYRGYVPEVCLRGWSQILQQIQDGGRRPSWIS